MYKNDNTIPDEVYEEAQVYDAIMILRETRHYGHNLDVTEDMIWCSDCEVIVDGK